MGIEHPLGLEVASCPHALYMKNTQSQLSKSRILFFKIPIFLFKNPSEVSDEELNDDLLQSDDEDVNMR